jgi:hypothetical protein
MKNIMVTNKKQKGEKMNIDLNFLKDLENNDKIKNAQKIITEMIGKVNPEAAKEILGSFLNNKGIVEAGKKLIEKNLNGITNIFGKK